jgi:hypothetical protein
MTTNKDFKRLVRGRMRKTGESYTAARSHYLKKPGGTSVVAPIDYARLAGMMSDAAVKAKTGCTWEKWVQALDYAKAYEWQHREIAEYVHQKFKVPGWWSQTVTVGYERIKGLRAKGQRRDGGYEVNKSRTFPVPLARLYRGFSDKRNRAKWLPGVYCTVRTAIRDKSMRISWPDGSSVQAIFLSKGAGKSTVHVQHHKLPNQAVADKVKEFWAERLSVLGEVLS